MCTTLPRVLITVMGIEKVLPRFEDLEVFLQLLPRSATGERMNPYTSLWTGVRAGDGPEAFHLVLLDNGRTRVLADPGRPAGAGVHPLRRLPQRLPGVRPHRRPRLPLGLPRARSARSSRRSSRASRGVRRCRSRPRCAARASTRARCGSTSPRCCCTCARRRSRQDRTSTPRRRVGVDELVAWLFESPRRLAAAEAARPARSGGFCSGLVCSADSRARSPRGAAVATCHACPCARSARAGETVERARRGAGARTPGARGRAPRPSNRTTPRSNAPTRARWGSRPTRSSRASSSVSPTTAPRSAAAGSGDEATTIAEALSVHRALRVGIPADLPPALRPAGVELVEDTGLPTRGAAGLEGLDGVADDVLGRDRRDRHDLPGRGSRRRSPGAHARPRSARVRGAGRPHRRQRARGDRGAGRGSARGTADHARLRAVGDERHRDEPRRGRARSAAPRRRARGLGAVARRRARRRPAPARAGVRPRARRSRASGSRPGGSPAGRSRALRPRARRLQANRPQAHRPPRSRPRRRRSHPSNTLLHASRTSFQ